MAARGSVAKEWATQKIIECFGQDNVIIVDKKLYVNTKEDGTPIQVAISLTCPKTMVGISEEQTPAAPKFSGGIDFENMGASSFAAPTAQAPAEITQSERDTVLELMKSLGL